MRAWVVVALAVLFCIGCERRYYDITIVAPGGVDTVTVEVTDSIVPTDTLVWEDTVSLYYGLQPMVEFEQEYGEYNGKEERIAFKFIANNGVVYQWRWIVPEWTTYESKLYGLVTAELELRIAPHWESTILDTVDITWWYDSLGTLLPSNVRDG